jgi:hypothetical protein
MRPYRTLIFAALLAAGCAKQQGVTASAPDLRTTPDADVRPVMPTLGQEGAATVAAAFDAAVDHPRLLVLVSPT